MSDGVKVLHAEVERLKVAVADLQATVKALETRFAARDWDWQGTEARVVDLTEEVARLAKASRSRKKT